MAAITAVCILFMDCWLTYRFLNYLCIFYIGHIYIVVVMVLRKNAVSCLVQILQHQTKERYICMLIVYNLCKLFAYYIK